MSSNDIDIMSHVRTFCPEIKADVLKNQNTPNSTSATRPPPTRAQSSAAKLAVTNGEITKAVSVSANKRRKVSQVDTSSSSDSRRARLGSERVHANNRPKRGVSKSLTAEEMKEKTRSSLTKQL